MRLVVVILTALSVNAVPSALNPKTLDPDMISGTLASITKKLTSGQASFEELASVKESLTIIASSAGTPPHVRDEAIRAIKAIASAEEANVLGQDRALQWASAVIDRVGRANDRKLIFSDEFDQLDHSVWTHEITMSGGGNWEFEYYTNNRTNSYVRDGVLYLRPTLTSDRLGEAAVRNGGNLNLNGDRYSYSSCTDSSFYGCERTSTGANLINPVQSASIKTINSFSFQYGTVEVRAQLPKGDWIWPAIWMLPRRDKYGGWPASGEIDIMESRGNANGYPGGVNSYGATLHYGPFWPIDPWQTAHGTYTLPSGDFSDDFHVFGFSWSADSMVAYLDDPSNVVMNVSLANTSFWELGKFPPGLSNPWESSPNPNAPFDQEYFIKFNVAVGGVNAYWPDGVGGKPWSNNSPTAALDFYNGKGQWYPTWDGEKTAMKVDWVRVYQ